MTTLEVDVLKEDSIANAASEVSKKYGKDSLRMLINVSGIVSLSSPLLKYIADFCA